METGGGRWKSWLAVGGKVALALFGLAVVFVFLDVVFTGTGSDYFSDSVAEGVLHVVGDLIFLFTIFAVGAIGSFLSFWALIWGAAWVSTLFERGNRH